MLPLCCSSHDDTADYDVGGTRRLGLNPPSAFPSMRACIAPQWDSSTLCMLLHVGLVALHSIPFNSP